MKSKYNPLSSSVLGLSRLLVRGLFPGILAFAPAAWAETITFPNPQAPNPGTPYNWTVPASVTSVIVECRGGGGAGGSVHSIIGGNARGGGGAGGNYARTESISVTPGQTYIVTVGAGGVAPTVPGFTHKTSTLPQTGGTSSFTSQDLTNTVVQAAGGIGGQNAVGADAASTAANGNAGGGTQPALDSTTIGTFRFKGGNGGSSWGGTLGSGTGGGGAGNQANGGNGSNNAGFTDEQRRGAGGVNGGGIGALGAALNNPGTAGAAPGGGGSGGARNNTTTNGNFAIGGSGGAGTVTLTFAVNTGIAKYEVTGISPQTVTDGAGFDVTITAKDSSDQIVLDNVNIVTMSSPTSGSLMEFDWDSNGTFGDNSGTLDNGVKTIKARNKKAQTVDIVASTGAVTTTLPLSMTTTAGAYASLQILVPGQTAAPGTLTGRTGTPSARTVGTGFSIFVNAVDAFFNRVVENTDQVSISSTDTAVVWPSGALLIDGTIEFPSQTFLTPGTHTLTASNLTTVGSVVSPNITVNAIAATWVGDGSANVWDNDTTSNWLVNGGSSTFSANYGVTFNDTGSIAPAVDIVGSVSPHTVTVNNSVSFPYSFTNGSIIGTAGGFNKTGAGTLTLANANTYTGPTTLSGGGLLVLQNVSALPATSALTLNGGVIGLNAGGFTRALGTSAGQVNLTGNNSGFAAYGANRALNFGGASAPVTWGSGNFMHDGSGIQSTFLLSRADATHTLDFQNPVVLSGTRFFNVPDGGATVDAILSGAITGSTTFSKAGAGTLAITNTSNAWTGITYIDDGILTLGASEVIPGAIVIKKSSTAGSAFVSALDLNGFNETVTTLEFGDSGGSSGSGNAGQTPELRNTGLSTATITVTGTITYQAGTGGVNGQATVSAKLHAGTGTKTINVGNGSAAVDLLISGSLSGESIDKTGLGALSVSSPNHTGNTTVTAGTMTLGAANPNNDASTVTVATGGVLNLNYTGTDKVLSLVIGANPPVADGVYGAADFPGIITGTGTITVGAAPVDPYLAWASGDAGVLFDGDANNDGVANGLAWLLGAANPTASVVRPTITQTAGALQISFSMLNAAGRGASGIRVQHSSNLGISDLWADSALVPDAAGISSAVNGVTFNVTLNNTPTTNGVIATVANTEAAAGKLFGRLKAEK